MTAPSFPPKSLETISMRLLTLAVVATTALAAPVLHAQVRAPAPPILIRDRKSVV